ncbi:MAG: substrate-binding domain-containing protein [Alphaproteobacteria bacterium]|nr:substrate-binding domain-containing protein [Alphaproteobacteria bacterium]
MSKIGLKALSEHLGLTEGTVSRAINDYPDISARTRERVKSAAAELGYRPNSSARRLATGNAECIGYVMPWQDGHISEPFLGELLDGMSQMVSGRHWDVNLAVSRSARDELDIISRMSASGRVSGVVISRIMTHDPRIEKLREMGIPFVTHGRSLKSDDHAWFDIDNFSAFREAVCHLVGLDHKAIAHIHGPLDYNFSVSRLAGYRRGLLDNNIDVDPAFEAKSDMTVNGGYRAMRYLLSLSDKPTAVVCVSDMVAIGAMKAIREFGWHPGREISIIGYDGVPISEHTYPALTTLAQPLQSAGARIAEMLLAVIDGDNPSDHQELWRATLVRRETDGPPTILE